jgi:CheY-like chemotaxis protein
MYKMILLDDDEVRAESAARILRASGYEVQPTNGEEIWQALRQLSGNATAEARVVDGYIHIDIAGKTYKFKR